MLRSIVQVCLKSRFAVAILAAGFLAFGIARLGDAPVDVLPEFSLPYVEIQTEALGLSAEEVEQLVTLGMEQDLLNGIPWVQSIRSESLPGLSSVVMVFKPGTDLMRARQMVAERMSQAYMLPHVSKPPVMIQPRSATSRVMIVGLSSQTLSPIQMSTLARWTVVPRLKGVPGVANVAIWGQRDRQLQVRVDPAKLQDNGVSLLKVLETTGNALWSSTLSFVEASTPGSGGFIDTHNQRLGIRHIFPIVSAEGLAQVPIEESGKRLGDVASVVEDHQPLIGDAITKDGGGLLLVIEKFPAANTLEVTQDVEEALNELLPGLPGMQVDSKVYRPADFIEQAIGNLGVAVSIGLVLALVLVFLFFADWRTTLISFIAVPLSIVAAGLVLELTGATINAIVLAGFAIAVGIIVYDAVFDVDNIVRRLHESRSAGRNDSTAHTILQASLESRRSLVFGTLILLLTMAPIFWMGGAAGAFYRPLAISYGLAILASMLVAWTVTPALCMIFLSAATGKRRTPTLVTSLGRWYDAAVGRMLGKSALALAAVVLLTAITAVLLPRLDRSLVPSFKETSLVIDLSSMRGTSQPEMTRISGRVRDELKSIHGVNDVNAHIGRAVLGDRAVDVHSAQLWVSLDGGAGYEQTATAIQHVLDGYPGVNHKVHTYLRGISEDVVPSADDKVVVRVYGETEAGLRERAEQVRQAIAGVSGVTETRTKLPAQQAAIEVQVDIAAAQRHGLKPGDVRRAAATLMSGLVVGNLYEEQKIFEVVVWSSPATRHSVTSVGNLMIDTPAGGRVRLGDVAQVHIVPASAVIRHDAVKRYIDVAADVEQRNLAAVAGDISQKLHELKFPLEYHAEVLGDHAASQAERAQLLSVVAAAVIGVFILFQAAFASWRLAALALLTLPAALSGGVVVALLAHLDLSIGSLAGLLCVFGIAVYNRVALIGRYQQLERDEGQPFGLALVARGSRDKLPPILLICLVAAAVVVPALFLGDVPGLEIVRPMAMVTIAGLITTALLDLFLNPALFLRLGVRSAHEIDPILDAPADLALGSVPASAAAND
ncbi:MAG: efflux RND transporter permease subunit [Leptothrix sp. (in: b-proteobacteria)]